MPPSEPWIHDPSCHWISISYIWPFFLIITDKSSHWPNILNVTVISHNDQKNLVIRVSRYIYIYLYRLNPLKITGLNKYIGFHFWPFKKKGVIIKNPGFPRYLYFHIYIYIYIYPIYPGPCPALKPQVLMGVGIERLGMPQCHANWYHWAINHVQSDI